MSDDLKQRIREFFGEMREGRTDNLAPLFADDAVMHSPMGDLHGPAEISRLGGQFKSALPDGRLTVSELAVDGDVVAYRVTGEGTHEGEFAGIAPTGKRITWTNNDVARVRDGVIVELWGGPDMFSIMTQLGAIPQPAATS